ncbi:hypothetical protein [Pseudomonas glycinae]|uniref:hypothetical protein n=1 Tax=Pseudomonas glycinae TaxID=1785145 RepID=UPI00283AA72D|nr:hypothetical protein [Pseudomonas glycinae]
MIDAIVGPPDEHSWDDQIDANTELFRKADQLDEAAYNIIQMIETMQMLGCGLPKPRPALTLAARPPIKTG